MDEHGAVGERNSAPVHRDEDGNIITTTGKGDRKTPLRVLKSSATVPLSAKWMKSVSGIWCLECATNSFGPTDSSKKHDDDDQSWNSSSFRYDLDALARQKSAASPLVVAPMMNPISTLDQNTPDTVQGLLREYRTACSLYGGEMNAGVMTTLRFQLPSMRVTSPFGDRDMLALTELLLRHCNGRLRYLHRLDFAQSPSLPPNHRLGSHGAIALAKVMSQSQYIHRVSLENNPIGAYGASALFIAAAQNDTWRKVGLRRCNIGSRGARVCAELIITSSECALVELDLSVNHIPFPAILEIEEALSRRNKLNLPPMILDLEGNLVFQEVMNGVTHGLGVILAIVGAWLLSDRVRGRPHRYVISCAVYSTSLLALYTSSTLYHSFFALRYTKWIFQVMDKCAIYILIAGSYTPFLQITLSHEPRFSVYLLAFLWVCCFLGITVEASYPTWQYKTLFSLTMYLSMGWSALICLPQVAATVPPAAMKLVVLGGVGYTAGVPFFVRDNNLDHAIWHIFVLTASILHWYAIYEYVTQL